MTQKLTWSRGWDQITGFMRRAALAETAAHVEYLQRAGRLIASQASAHAPYRLAVAAHRGAPAG